MASSFEKSVKGATKIKVSEGFRRPDFAQRIYTVGQFANWLFFGIGGSSEVKVRSHLKHPELRNTC